MAIEKFEDIVAWQKAKKLNVEIYSFSKLLKDYSFKDQIQRASVSIMNNIAEGFERKSNKELKQFLFIAKGSCGEVRSMLHLALDLNYIKNDQYDSLVSKAVEVSKMISGFISKI